MAQTVLITLTIAGTDTGPFSLYSDADGFVIPFETSVSKATLQSGYVSTSVPNPATIIKVVSLGTCTNSIFLPISGSSVTTTTTSSTTSSTSSSTTSTTSTATVLPCNCYQIQDAEAPGGATGSYTDCDGVSQLFIVDELSTVYICTRDVDSISSTDNIQINLIEPSSPFYENCPCITTTTTTTIP